MPYSKFTWEKLKDQFNLDTEQCTMFNNIQPIAESPWLKETLQLGLLNPLLSKKARSENIVAPILTHLRTQNNNSFTLYSGIDLPADLAKGLNGECDFLLGNMPKAINLKAPIFTIVEAKHENIVKYTPQAAAQMLGARVYNQKRNNPIDNIYGCITTGTEWQFLLLKENTIFVDNQLYPLANLQLLLGILQQIVDFYQKK